MSTRRLIIAGAAICIGVLLLGGFVWALLDKVLDPVVVSGLEHAARLWSKPLAQIGNVSLSIEFAFKAIIFLLLLSLVARKSRIVLRRYLLDRIPLDSGQRYAIETGTGYVILLLGIAVGLDSAGLDLSALTIIGGAVGIGIGFGLQTIANNFVSGLILLFERPVRVGDRVEVGHLVGQVMRIGSRSTWVSTNDNIVVILPNSDFISKPVINWTATDRLVRFVVPVGVSYSSNPDHVRECLLDVARRNPDVRTDRSPDVIFMGFGDSALQFELRVWTSSKVDLPNVLKSDLYFEIFRVFHRERIEIPFPQRDLHLRSISAEQPLKTLEASAAVSRE